MSTPPHSTSTRRPLLGWALAWFAGAAALAAPLPAPAQGGGLVVIVKEASAIRVASAVELRSVFGGRGRTVQGVSVVPLNLAPEDSSRQAFDRAVLGLERDRVARHWIDARIRDGSQAPRTVPSAATMVRAVAALSNGIGYVPSGTPMTGVKVVARVRAGRLEQP